MKKLLTTTFVCLFLGNIIFPFAAAAHDLTGINHVEGNLPPEIDVLPTMTYNTPDALSYIDLNEYGRDPEGGHLTWQVTVSSEHVSLSEQNGYLEIDWVEPDWSGTEYAEIKATDPEGLSSIAQIEVIVYPKDTSNLPPVIEPLPDLVVTNQMDLPSLYLPDYISDPEGGPVQFRPQIFTSDKVQLTVSGDYLLISTIQPGWFGTESHNIIAFDNLNQYTSGPINIVVNSGSDLPPGEDDPPIETGCARIYSKNYYRDSLADFCIGDYDQQSLSTKINSLGTLVITQGVEVIFYSGENLDGESVSISKHVKDLEKVSLGSCGNIANCAKSMKVQKVGRDTNVINKKLMLITFNPYLPSKGQYLIDFGQANGWNDPHSLNQRLVNWFNSTGQVNYNVVLDIEHNDFVIKRDKFKYDETSYLKCLADNANNCHVPDEADYKWIVDYFDICEKFNAGEIDEVWLQGGEFFGFAESRLVGPNGYWYNSTPIYDTNCKTNIPVMGYNYQRNVREMKHNYMHRFESTMMKFFNGWDANKVRNPWERFSLVDFLAPDFNVSGCGNGHWAPNTLVEYVHHNLDYVDSYCDAFYDYPNVENYDSYLKRINCEEWGCQGEGYYDWWFNHFPNKVGYSADGFANNWWIYLIEPNSVLPQSTAENVGENLAKNKKIKTKAGTLVDSKFNDGFAEIETTTWSINNSVYLDASRQYLTLDLESNYLINKINIQSDAKNDITLQISNDNRSWRNLTDFYVIDEMTGLVSRSFDINEEPGQFVRMWLKDPNKKYNFSEIEVYGEPNTIVVDNEPPVVNAGIDLITPRTTTITLEATAFDEEGDELFYEWEMNPYKPNVIIKSPNSLKTEVEIPYLSYQTQIDFTLNVYDGYHVASTDSLKYTSGYIYPDGIIRAETNPINLNVNKNLNNLFDGSLNLDSGGKIVNHNGQSLEVLFEFVEPRSVNRLQVAYGDKFDIYAADSWSDMVNNINVRKVGDSIPASNTALSTLNFPTTTAKVLKLSSKSEIPKEHKLVEIKMVVPNQPPEMQSLPTLRIYEDNPLPDMILDLYDFAFDPDGDSISFEIVRQSDHVQFYLEGGEVYMEDLEPNWSGDDYITIKVKDAPGAYIYSVMYFSVDPVDDDIYLNELPDFILNEDGYTEGFYLNDYLIDPENEPVEWSITKSTNQDNISVSFGEDSYIEIDWLRENWNGEDWVEITAENAEGNSASGRIDIKVLPVEDEIQIINPLPSFNFNEDSLPEALNLLASILNPDNLVLNWNLGSLPNPNIKVSLTNVGILKVDSVTPNWNGVDYVFVEVTDQTGTRLSLQIQIKINPVDDPISFINPLPSFVLNEDSTTAPINLSEKVVNIDNETLKWIISRSPNDNIKMSISSTGSLSIDSITPNWNGSDYVIVDVLETNGNKISGQINIEVKPVNDPLAFEGTLPSINANEDTKINPIELISKIINIDNDPLTWKLTRLPNLNIKVSLNTSGILSIDSMTPDWNGNDYLIFEVSEPSGNKVSGQINIQINPVDDPIGLKPLPQFNINEDSLRKIIDTKIPSDLGNTIKLGNYLIDPDNDQITWSIIREPNTNITMSIQEDLLTINSLAPDWNGSDFVTIEAKDSNGNIITGNVVIIINPVNDSPTLDDILDQNALIASSYQYQLKSTDVDGDKLTFTLVSGPSGLTLGSDTGLVNWRAGNLQHGTYTVSVSVSDGKLTVTKSFILNAIFADEIIEPFNNFNNLALTDTTGFEIGSENGKSYVFTNKTDNGKLSLGTKWIEPVIGTTYNLKIKIRTVNADKPEIIVALYDENKVKIGNYVTLYGVDGTTNWTEYSKSFAVPSTYNTKSVKYARIFIKIGDKYDSVSTTNARTYFNYMYFTRP